MDPKFDMGKTLELIRGGLIDREATWHRYLGENPGWRETLFNLAGPLIVANVLLSMVLSGLVGTFTPYYGLADNWLAAFVMGLVLAAIGFAIAVWVFNFLAGMFGGKSDFPRAFAAVSLAAIPAWIAGIIGAAIPWVGGLISLAGAIVTLVFLYQIMPLALRVPENKRVVHFVVSLVVIFIANLVVVGVTGLGSRGPVPDFDGARFERDRDETPGMLGEIGRQAELIARAKEASYEPPQDGEVSREQARWVADTLNKARDTYQEEMDRLEELSGQIEDKENPSPADMVKIYQGMGTVASLNSIELETVMAGGGNWAEYQWVKTQLRNARLQRGEGSDTLEHNYGRYREIEDDLEGGL